MIYPIYPVHPVKKIKKMTYKKNIYQRLIPAILIFTVFIFGCTKPGYPGKKVIVLGFDGLDPRVVKKMASNGKLPNFKILMESGSFSKLKTTLPPQSPVAWSTFITGTNPGKHNVFDFLARDPETYMPKLTITEIKSPRHINVGSYSIPIGSPDLVSYRQGTPFWEITQKNGISTTILQVPVTFPPDENVTMLSGMGVPDILGTNGTFSFYTTDSKEKKPTTGGKVIIVDRFEDEIKTELIGPKNEFKVNKPDTKIPLRIEILDDLKIQIRLMDKTISLSIGEWSTWVNVEFPMVKYINVKGILRFYLVGISPHFALYVSPVNLDPTDPVLPISNPKDYSAALAKKFGYFYTQGMPEDTWALNELRLNDRAFLELTEFIQNERILIFKNELRKLDKGLLVSVFVSPDRIQHMFYRYIDEKNPLHEETRLYRENRNTIEKVYEYCDRILGAALKYVDDKTTLIVLSDHGFTTFRQTVHLNTWLAKNGFLQFIDPNINKSDEFFNNIDLGSSKAYALGLNSIYINLHGREKYGIVKPGAEMEKVKTEIIKKLEQFTDPETGAQVVKKVYDSAKEYKGSYMKNAPDLIVGYYEGYRTSWQTALGGAPEKLLEDNKKKWSGDHLIDPDLVPGVFLSNKKIQVNDPALIDMAPTILAEFGLKPAKEMEGRVIF